ncbi:hypothetical protein I79_008798 [Cricetulus griseus]|uniref:Uncharacterized protein n=1 Tax=Cricetulus griseus TaxID=10029 RepID=G3HE27_CRIGR|nr:hypothetical protein I79_008798 [Cricetulus griseus]
MVLWYAGRQSWEGSPLFHIWISRQQEKREEETLGLASTLETSKPVIDLLEQGHISSQFLSLVTKLSNL